MQQFVLLLEDISNTARKGEIVKVKSGYARNFLLPQNKAVLVSKRTKRLQDELKQQRALQAEKDRKVSLELAAKLKDLTFTTKTKVDTAGHMYGSVAINDLIKLLAEEEISLEKRHFRLPKPLKKLGSHQVMLVLDENVEAVMNVQINPEKGAVLQQASVEKQQNESQSNHADSQESDSEASSEEANASNDGDQE